MRVVFVTATRADFGKLKPLILALQEHLDVRVFVTGMHMLTKYGSTYREVLRAGVTQPYLFSNQRAGDPMDYILARTIQGLGDYLKENEADVVVVHGDRVEAMAGALAAALHNVLVVHIEGGEVSGTVDEHLRHAVTKLAHLHFVANEEAMRRVLQLGERPEAVHVTGSPDLDVMSSGDLPTLQEARDRYGITAIEYGICIFHPVTTEVEVAGRHAEELMAAMDESQKDWVVIFPNNDHGSQAIMDVYRRYEGNDRFRFFPSIRFEYFLVLMRHCSLMVGNSSAGIREIPFYGRYAIDVGTRQRNRTSSPMVIHAGAERRELLARIDERWGQSDEPSSEFGDGRSTERIVKIFLSMDGQGGNVQKVFRDIPGESDESRAAMNDMQGQLREVQLRLMSTQLDQQYQRNLALFEAVMPEAFELLRGREPTVVHLNYDDAGFVNLVNSHDDSPVYAGDPRAYAEAQVAQYRRHPKHLVAGNKRTTVLDEENNAHLFNSNRTVDLLEEHPQERFEELPDYVNFMLMLGVGLGYQFELLQEATHIRHLCLIEPEIDIFQASCHTIDWQPILEHFSRPGYSLELIVGQDADGCYRDLDSYLGDIGAHNAVLPFIYEHVVSDKLASSFQDFLGRLMPQRLSARGYFDDEQVGLAHSVRNFAKGVPVLQKHVLLGGEFLDAPAFIVANGPSLDGAVDFLRESQPNAIVFSCGTALGSLKKAGIKPDFHVEMERSRPVLEWISGATDEADREGVTLLALNTVHPEVLELFSRVALAMKPNDAGTLFLSRYMAPDSHVISLEDSNPTVGNLALALVSALGFRDVYLFGMDLGFGASGEHHSALSAHYDVKKSERYTLGLYRHDSEHNLVEDGNFGGKVTTTLVYRAAKLSAERVLAKNPGMRCHNTSDGLLIEGSIPTRVAGIELAEGLLDKARLVDKVFAGAFSREGLLPLRLQDAGAVFQRTSQALDTLAAIALTTANSREQGMDVLGRLHAEVTAMAQDDDEQFAASLLKGSVSVFCLLLAQALHRSTSEDESVALYRRGVDRFVAFCEAARTKVDTDLLAVDSRTRNLKEKLAVGGV